MTPTYQIRAWFTSDLLDDFGVWSFLEESSISSQLGGGFKYVFFHPYLGKISNLTNILGWNHQPDKVGSIIDYNIVVTFKTVPCMLQQVSNEKDLVV